jgi:hypothetical protein
MGSRGVQFDDSAVRLFGEFIESRVAIRIAQHLPSHGVVRCERDLLPCGADGFSLLTSLAIGKRQRDRPFRRRGIDAQGVLGSDFRSLDISLVVLYEVSRLIP